MNTPEEILDSIEKDLSSPEFMGIPLGPTLNDSILAHLYGRLNERKFRSWILSPLREWRYSYWPCHARRAHRDLPKERILVTWSNSKFHYSQLVRPIVDQIGYGNCLVVAANESVSTSLPQGLGCITWRESLHYDLRQWRGAFASVWPSLKRRLHAACSRYGFPSEVVSSLRLNLMLSSQYVAGCERFLVETRPCAILTDYDRNRLWSVLVMVGRRLGIPTYTLVHGVLNDHAVGFVPVLADKIFCWGQIDRKKFVAAGTDPTRLLIAGCPRLQRGLSADQAAARSKAALSADKPLVLLATAPYNISMRQSLAGIFCEGIGRVPGALGAVRLHPSEDLDVYARVMAKHPTVRFFTNSALTVDEAIAAADAVVVHCSGFGSDALTKGCPVIVLDVLDQPLGHGAELIRYADCAAPRNAEELAAAVQLLLFDAQAREKAIRAAQAFTQLFCVAFGDDAARNIARTVLSAKKEPPKD